MKRRAFIKGILTIGTAGAAGAKVDIDLSARPGTADLSDPFTAEKEAQRKINNLFAGDIKVDNRKVRTATEVQALKDQAIERLADHWEKHIKRVVLDTITK